MRKRPLYFLLLPLLLGLQISSAAEPDIYTYRILDSREHNAAYFTQGLISEGNWIYESAGGYGQSQLLRYHKLSGQIDAQFKLPSQLFAEGLTLFRDHIYLLTWHAGLMLVFDANALQPLARFNYQGEGWGLTHDGEHLIMSDGSERIYFRRPRDFSIQRTITVHDDKKSWQQLNELEYVQGKIWANVWQDDRILIIEPADGRIVGVADLKLLRRNTVKVNHRNVVNGIAYDAEKQAFWITGKNWPKRYLIEFKSAKPQ